MKSREIYTPTKVRLLKAEKRGLYNDGLDN